MKLLKRIGVIIGSYLLACFVASFLVILCLSVFGGFNDTQWIDIETFFIFLGAGTGITFVGALIPAGAFILYSELAGRSGWAVHALAGALSGFIASTAYFLFLDAGFGGIDFAIVAAIILVPSVAGCIGAIVYWKLAVAPLQKNLKPEQMVDVF